MGCQQGLGVLEDPGLLVLSALVTAFPSQESVVTMKIRATLAWESSRFFP